MSSQFTDHLNDQQMVFLKVYIIKSDECSFTLGYISG